MNIVICGSVQFAREMLDLKQRLEASGHAVTVPKNAELYASGERSAETKWEKVEGDVIRSYWQKIGEADAVLVVNFTKNGVENYVGGNGLIEMAFAHVLEKKIFLLYPIPEMNYADEIASMKPTVLEGDLSRIRWEKKTEEEGKYAVRRRYDKLIRDKVVEHIHSHGKEALFHVADDAEYWAALKAKLAEEAQEYGINESLSELADLQEVFLAVCRHQGITPEAVEAERQKRAAAGGAFNDRIILEES
jgi:predicted house-cleaning noncanonical NTP pyrophosphatase (MazG superfamily)